MSTILRTLALHQPEWVFEQFEIHSSHTFMDEVQKTEFVINLSETNCTKGTGGPFGAAVFNRNTGRLVSCGVNTTVPSQLPICHAEIMAIVYACKSLGRYSLHTEDKAFELVTSCEPCCMCTGAFFWSGIQNLVCAAREEDARNAGFDEGKKALDWKEDLQQRGITVKTDVLRGQAAAVFGKYLEHGGKMYNF